MLAVAAAAAAAAAATAATPNKHGCYVVCKLKILVNPAFFGKAPFYKGKPFNC